MKRSPAGMSRKNSTTPFRVSLSTSQGVMVADARTGARSAARQARMLVEAMSWTGREERGWLGRREPTPQVQKELEAPLDQDHFTCEDLPKKLLFRPEEVAFHLSISKQTVYRWVDQGRIKAVRIHGLVRIPRMEILRKLAQIGTL